MTDDKTIESGDTVYDGDGTEIGTVTGVTTDGLRVAADEEVEYVSDDNEYHDELLSIYHVDTGRDWRGGRIVVL